MFSKDDIPIVGILRGIEEKHLLPIKELCIRTGLKYIEITMNTKGAPDLIRKMSEFSNEKIKVGAGTVLNRNDLRLALDAGAEFIVCPSVVEEVINQCVRQNIPVFPGALTPTEVHKAWDMGAEMIKLFPANAFGPSYIKDLKGPFDKIKIMAVGGVCEQNIPIFFNNGADAVAFGSSIFKPEWLKTKQFELIEEKIRMLIRSYKGERGC